ncbi:MAG: lipopolysaccharide biosynthesis protein, partial [Deltaproteobacteria bacterium]|nr:lipopolysaccharide biosynthesis protein [Deltaproteobacteria bacterium]
NPLELLSSQRFADLLDQLAEQYDRVVIDSAPCQVVSDALMLSRRASAVVYVVKADATPYHVAQRGIKRLHEYGAPLLGVVLNQVDTAKATRYYGKYGYYRHDYQPGYGYDTGRDSEKAA